MNNQKHPAKKYIEINMKLKGLDSPVRAPEIQKHKIQYFYPHEVYNT